MCLTHKHKNLQWDSSRVSLILWRSSHFITSVPTRSTPVLVFEPKQKNASNWNTWLYQRHEFNQTSLMSRKEVRAYIDVATSLLLIYPQKKPVNTKITSIKLSKAIDSSVLVLMLNFQRLSWNLHQIRRILTAQNTASSTTNTGFQCNVSPVLTQRSVAFSTSSHLQYEFLCLVFTDQTALTEETNVDIFVPSWLTFSFSH